jgi:hypothetical protein
MHPVPRYYFTLRNASKTLVGDGMGTEFENDDAARQFARVGAGVVAPGPAMSSPHLARHHLHVTDANGHCVFDRLLSKLDSDEAP